MKKILFLCATMMILLVGCGKDNYDDATKIVLSDDAITVDGEAVSNDITSAVYIANDIVYYESGKGFTYGEGDSEDEHTAEEAASHTVVHISKAGRYLLSGKLSAGQIAVDLGEETKDNPEAEVTLILDGVDINCSVAPAVIFYNVYECGDKDNATKDVDTSKAGANVIIADGSTNNINGSHVARIYKSYELNEEGTEVIDNKKLHKYDAAFYSKMTMNVNGGSKGTGELNIVADNEGLDSELHLTINGGNIDITSGNDGINTNEDGVSVTTVNGGNLKINVTGSTGEGDGIDSNGWLVINGGTVTSYACGFSGDAGIDSDMGIHINGGTVMVSGNMLDRISESNQNYAVFTFASRQKGGQTYTLKNEKNKEILKVTPGNDFSILILSSKELKEGKYTLWNGDSKLSGYAGGNGMRGPGGFVGANMMKPEDFKMPEGIEKPEEGSMPPEGFTKPDGTKRPEGFTKPERTEMPDETEVPEEIKIPDGEMKRPNRGIQQNGEKITEFEIVKGGNYFSGTTEKWIVSLIALIALLVH